MYDISESPSPLPHGITIRTPSPVLGLPTVKARASQLTGEIQPKHFEHTEDSIPKPHSAMAPTTQTGIVDNASGSLARYAVSVYQDCAATIPWVDLYRALQCKHIHDLFPAVTSILTRVDITQTSSRTPFRLGASIMPCCRKSMTSYPQSSLTVLTEFILMN